MNISELIKYLSGIKDQIGDCEVVRVVCFNGFTDVTVSDEKGYADFANYKIGYE